MDNERLAARLVGRNIGSGGMSLSGDWEEFARIFNTKRFAGVLRMEIGKALWKASALVKKRLVESILNGGWDENNKIKSILRSDGPPLVSTKQMIRDIKRQILSDTDMFIGWDPSDTASGGLNYGKLLDLLVKEYYQEVTPKMRAFFASKGIHLSDNTQFLYHPARDFLSPVWNDLYMWEQIITIFEQHFAKAYLIRKYSPRRDIFVYD